MEQAEIEGNYYLDRCHSDYHRLPMLAMIAEVKEMLEKSLEAADLRKRLLRYSPENHEVLKAMAYGCLLYTSMEASRRRVSRAPSPQGIRPSSRPFSISRRHSLGASPDAR